MSHHSNQGNDAEANDINDFLQAFSRTQEARARYSSAATQPLNQSTVPRYHYAPSLMMSDASRPRYEPSLESIETGVTVESDRIGETQYSFSSAPSAYGVEPPNLQRPTVPPVFEPRSSEFLPDLGIPCEFHWYADCREEFQLDQYEQWVDHVVSTHLRFNLPTYCICWFCNEGFQAKSDGYEDKRTNYVSRTWHIADHFRQGTTIEDSRPDFFFLDHIHQNHLISEEKFRIAKDYHEAPQPRNGINMEPAAGNSQQDGVVEVRARHGRRREDKRTYRH